MKLNARYQEFPRSGPWCSADARPFLLLRLEMSSDIHFNSKIIAPPPQITSATDRRQISVTVFVFGDGVVLAMKYFPVSCEWDDEVWPGCLYQG